MDGEDAAALGRHDIADAIDLAVDARENNVERRMDDHEIKDRRSGWKLQFKPAGLIGFRVGHEWSEMRVPRNPIHVGHHDRRITRRHTPARSDTTLQNQFYVGRVVRGERDRNVLTAVIGILGGQPIAALIDGGDLKTSIAF